MASSSGSSSSSSTTGKVESLTCTVCLDVFSEPKFLPCFHTFCKKCLERLPVYEGKIRCPACRKSVKVPTGGVSAFQNNFHIDSEELEKARAGAYCTLHRKKEKDLFCLDCQVPVCTMCMLMDHKGHMMDDIVQGKAKVQLMTDQGRLEKSAEKLKRGVQELQDDMQAVLEKRETLAEIINKRHQALYGAADRLREEALDSMRSVAGSIRDRQTRDLQHRQRNAQKVTELQKELQQALDGGERAGLLDIAREMRCGRGREEALQLLNPAKMTTVRRPILRSGSTLDAILPSMKDFMGRAAEIEMPLTAETLPLSRQLTDVTVRVWAHCEEDKETEVCSLTPQSNGNLIVHYTPSIISNEMLTKTYRPDGTVVRIGNEMGMNNETVPAGTSITTNPRKFSQDTTRYFHLCYEEKPFKTQGRADVMMVEETKRQENPVKHESFTHQFLCCRPHAFDVQVNGKLVAVLETKEGDESGCQLCVQLYTRTRFDAIATYHPPITPYRPSDVCFYKLGGQEVLLVADELNDAIHVVNFDESGMTFLRYLAPGCPLLVQPTALSEDVQGRLWVACTGGRILVCTPAV